MKLICKLQVADKGSPWRLYGKTREICWPPSCSLCLAWFFGAILLSFDRPPTFSSESNGNTWT